MMALTFRKGDRVRLKFCTSETGEVSAEPEDDAVEVEVSWDRTGCAGEYAVETLEHIPDDEDWRPLSDLKDLDRGTVIDYVLGAMMFTTIKTVAVGSPEFKDVHGILQWRYSVFTPHHCPFCGEEPELQSTNDVRHQVELSYTVRCIECGAEVHDEHLEDVIIRWNTRIPMLDFKPKVEEV